MKKTLLVIVLLAMGCKSNPDKHIEFIEGYWEIESVYKDNQLLRTFKINSGIDYFKINADLKGFRKKLKPNFSGTFETSKDVLNFKIEIQNNDLFLNYIDNATSFREEVLEVNKEKLVIKSNSGLVYNYKPYEALDLSQ
tara:strand:- start:2994 stop:3410 length:417 start_codon:yes stop_codon:yes gene_type:complete